MITTTYFQLVTGTIISTTNIVTLSMNGWFTDDTAGDKTTVTGRIIFPNGTIKESKSIDFKPDHVVLTWEEEETEELGED